MSSYLITLNLNSPVHQDELIQALKREGAEVIQTSNGLCFKSAGPQEVLMEVLKNQGVSEDSVKPVTASTEGLTPDVETFINSKA